MCEAGAHFTHKETTGENPVNTKTANRQSAAARHLMCRRYAQHSHESAGRVKEAVVRYIVKRCTGNDTEWSAMHGPSSTSGVTKRRRRPVEEGRGGGGVEGGA